MERRYYQSIDIFRVFCMALLVLSAFGLPFSGFDALRPFLGFAPAVLFTLYGYLVLRGDDPLLPHILRTLIVFAVMFALFFGVNLGCSYLETGTLSYLTDFDFADFLLFNRFDANIVGCSLWMVQSLLYSLVLIWLFRFLKKFTTPICILFFVLSFALGECSSLFGISLFGYDFAGYNFITCTLPYLLLGRVIHKHRDFVAGLPNATGICLSFCGLLICYIERTVLTGNGYAVADTPLIGFIVIAFSLCLVAVQAPHLGRNTDFGEASSGLYHFIYFFYDIAGGALLFIFKLLKADLSSLVGIIVLLLSFAIPFCYSLIQSGRTAKKNRARGRKQDDEIYGK